MPTLVPEKEEVAEDLALPISNKSKVDTSIDWSTDSFQISQKPTPLFPEGRNAPATNNSYATTHRNMFIGIPSPVPEIEEVAKAPAVPSTKKFEELSAFLPEGLKMTTSTALTDSSPTIGPNIIDDLACSLCEVTSQTKTGLLTHMESCYTTTSFVCDE